MTLQLKSGLGLLFWGFLILLFRHAVGLLWTSDQPDAKASTYTEQHNTKMNILAPIGIRAHDPCNEQAKTYALDRASPRDRNW
jgi:nucleosome binding factor SPN SPT16 subunit